MNKDKRNNIQLLGTLNNADESGIIANANQIYDANEDKSTQDVSKEHKERIETLETKESSMQTTLENITKTGEASAASNVTYNHNDSQLDATNVQQAVDEISTKTVFDISAYHATGGTLATYDNLEDALGTNGENIPQSLKKGGMSIKFVQSSDNKYVQYFLTKNVWSASKADWEKMNLEEEISQLGQKVSEIETYRCIFGYVKLSNANAVKVASAFKKLDVYNVPDVANPSISVWGVKRNVNNQWVIQLIHTEPSYFTQYGYLINVVLASEQNHIEYTASGRTAIIDIDWSILDNGFSYAFTRSDIILSSVSVHYDFPFYDESVGSSKIADGAVTRPKLAAGAGVSCPEYTSGESFSNSFIKELYIPGGWDASIYTLAMYNCTRAGSGGYTNNQIHICAKETYDQSTGDGDGFAYVGKQKNGVITLDGTGDFAGRKAFAILDFDQFWKNNGIDKGIICTYAKINQSMVIDLDKNPSIKQYVVPVSINEPSGFPVDALQIPSFAPPSGDYQSVDVSTFADLQALQSNGKYLVNLLADIVITQPISFNYDIIVKGNGHKIYQFIDGISSVSVVNGRKSGSVSIQPTGQEVFSSDKGKLLKYAQTEPIPFSDSDLSYNSTTNICTVQLPNQFSGLAISSSDDVFVEFGWWFYRVYGKVTSVINGLLTFSPASYYKPTGASGLQSLHLYFKNIGGYNDGILIKNGVLSYPAVYGGVSLLLSDVVVNDSGYYMEFDNVKFPNPSGLFRANGISAFSNCHFYNSMGKQIILNYNRCSVSECTFNDIDSECINSADSVSPGSASPRTFVSVVDCEFSRIGKTAGNTGAIVARGDAFIARNKIKDFMYSAIYIGVIATSKENSLPYSIIEDNLIIWTKKWQSEMFVWGLSDSGAIYVAPNNKQCIVRKNVIANYGIGSQYGIFVDDGGFNVYLYQNIVGNIGGGTPCIYFRWDSSWAVTPPRRVPDGYEANTNSMVSYNVVDGILRSEGKPQPTTQAENNFVCLSNYRINGLANNIKADIINNVDGDTETIKVSGVIDSNGFLFSSSDFSKIHK